MPDPQSETEQKRLEILIHQQLSALPPLRAPATLAPRVLEQLQKGPAKTLWGRSWFDWPLGCQVISAAIFLCGLTFLLYTGSQWIAPGEAAVVNWFSETFGWMAALGKAPVITFQALNLPGWKMLLSLSLLAAVSLYLWCFGLGLVCFKIAFAESKFTA